MALTDPLGTLAYHSSRPLTVARDMSKTPLNLVTQKIAVYQASHSADAVPEKEAFWFYGLNHAVSVIRQNYDTHQPLPADLDDVVDTYYQILSQKAVRAFYYLVMICVKEARHNQDKPSTKDYVSKTFNPALGDFLAHSGQEEGILKRLLETPPEGTTLGDLTQALRWGYYNSAWNSSFGGPAWGAVTDCLNRFVHGEITPEMMLDTNWTLAHNNGPIFNKGMLYASYGNHLKRVLDLQRGGYIPEAMMNDDKTASFVSPSLKQLLILVNKRFKFIRPYIDWFHVEKLGAVQTYEEEKKLQKKAFGPSIHDMPEPVIAEKKSMPKPDPFSDEAMMGTYIDPTLPKAPMPFKQLTKPTVYTVDAKTSVPIKPRKKAAA